MTDRRSYGEEFTVQAVKLASPPYIPARNVERNIPRIVQEGGQAAYRS